MIITLEHIERSSPQALPNVSALGYRCRFTSESGSGQALFVSATPDLEACLGKPLAVETMLSGLADFEALAAPPDEPDGLAALPTPGDYRATGKVNAIVWLDDEMENALIEAAVGECRFTFPSEAAGHADLDYGQWLRFTIHGLILWQLPN